MFWLAGSPVFNSLYDDDPTKEAIAQMALRPDQIMSAEGAWPYENLSRYGIGAGDFATGGVYAMNDDYMRKVDALYGALPPEIAELVSVNSGYRDPGYNASVGGKPESRHLYGDAVDFGIDSLTPEQREVFSQAAADVGFGGVGGYHGKLGHVHLDAGPSRTWGEMHPGIDQALIRGISGEGQPVEMPSVPVLSAGADPGRPADMYGDEQQPIFGAMAPDDRSGARRYWDWMGDEGFMSSLLTGAGLLIGGNEALPMLGEYGGQYDQFEGDRSSRRRMQAALSQLSGSLSDDDMSIVNSLATAGMVDKAMEFAVSAAKGREQDLASVTDGTGQPYVWDQNTGKVIGTIGNARPEKATNTAGTPNMREAGLIAMGEGYALNSPAYRRRVAELLRQWNDKGASGVPTGYRKTDTGDLEAIPGGPADPTTKPVEYERVTGPDGIERYVPTQPGRGQVQPVEGMPAKTADPDIGTVTDAKTGQTILWDRKTGNEMGRLGGHRVEPDTSTGDQKHAIQVAELRAREKGLKVPTREYQEFVEDESARIIEAMMKTGNDLERAVDLVNLEDKFINRLNKESAYRSYTDMADAYPSLETAAQLAAAGNSQAALTAIINFVKTTDPDSVVRETESGAVVSSSGLPEQVLGTVRWILGNSNVTPEAMENLMYTVRANLAARYKPAMDRYRVVSTSAKRVNGLDPDTFLRPPRHWSWMSQYEAEVERGDRSFPRPIANLPPIDLNEAARREAQEALRGFGMPHADQMGPLRDGR